MEKLKKFEQFSLNVWECSKIKGGSEAAYCTNGVNASCYQYFDDAVNACLSNLGCNRIEIVQV
ncbi:MAG: hypothetical protein WAZ98_14925 [Cyclobacteriaceae bacterium]